MTNKIAYKSKNNRIQKQINYIINEFVFDEYIGSNWSIPVLFGLYETYEILYGVYIG